MSKRQFKSQASSSRVSSAGFGGFGSATSSTLSYLSEPPNLISITDPNVVVAFKNLLKKDSTTKTKGLEDLKAYVQAHPFQRDGGVEDSILEAWVKQYPRISIDNSRRVRELSHSVQYELLKSARKRMEKHITAVVGAWLAGTYDRDRPVSRAASDGITSFLDTQEKELAFWRKCQSQILSYAQEAIEETPQTLSDERTVGPDDAKAKYDRVIGSSLSLVVNLLAKLNPEDTAKQQESYEAFLSGNKALWKFAASEDPFVRRTINQLLIVSLQKQDSIISQDLELLSGAFISEGLRASQSGSALQFMQALNILTAKHPEVWTSSYKGKKVPLSRLRHFIEKGSQSGPAEFWQLWGALIKKLPAGILPQDVDSSIVLLKAQRDGMSGREEARANAGVAWGSYFELVRVLKANTSESTSSTSIVASAVHPVFEQYLRPSTENSRWTIGNSTVALAKAFEICVQSASIESLKSEWLRLADLVVSGILTSLPAQSKDHIKSQTSVTAEAQRWFALQEEIVKQSASTREIDWISDASKHVIQKAIETLVNRDGKPFGAAGTIEAALRLSPSLVASGPAMETIISDFLEEHLPKLIVSPSGPYLTAALLAFKTIPGRQQDFEGIWQATVDGLLAVPESTQKRSSVKHLISYLDVSAMAKEDKQLQQYIVKNAKLAIQGDSEAFALYESAITFDSLDEAAADVVCDMTIDLLGTEYTEHVLSALEMISKKQPTLLKNEVLHVTLMTKLLAIGESADQGLTARVSKLKAALERGVSGGNVQLQSTVQIIQENLDDAGPQSLSIKTLVSQASEALAVRGDNESSTFFPSPEIWLTSSLQQLLSYAPNPAISLTNQLAGATFLVQNSEVVASDPPARDLNGFSIAFRKALYTSKLITASKGFESLSPELQVDLLRLLCITCELANDQLSLQQSNQLWTNLSDPDVESEVQDFLSEAQKIIVSFVSDSKTWRTAEGSSTLGGRLISRLLEQSNGMTSAAFYQARALATILSNAVEMNGWQTAGGEEWLASLDLLKTSTSDLFKATAVLTGLKETLSSSKLVSNLCNRLVSDIAGAKSDSAKTLGMMLYLNAAMSVYESGGLPVVQNRLVFAVRQITSWMEQEPVVQPELAAEMCRSLQMLFPCISGVYGSHWKTSLEYCIRLMSKPIAGERIDVRLPAYYGSMRLIATCRKLLLDADAEEKNEDIEEAFTSIAPAFPVGLLQLLKLPRSRENQPWRIVDELLSRELSTMPVTALQEPEDIYPLLASDSGLIQSTAYDLLQRYATAQAETINFDTVLEKQDAALPQELLSLLLDSPSLDRYPEDILIQFPAPIRSYLLSWHVVFDYYTKASYKVRSDYNENLKVENYVTPLLDFTFDFLGHSIAQALNLDNIRLTPDHIRHFHQKAASAETSEFEMQWLLVNLYYLCLKYIPSLTKSWWIDCKSKQTRIAVEAWTEKYFSPLIITDTLDEVAYWSEQQETPTDDEKELLIKVSKKSREVYAGYEVDDMQAQIVIRLPSNFPLEGVKVESVNRVAVGEKKWQSWLMITQGVIMFSNGSITDGLSTFRKNVTGALKGQTECAICYSIVSSDRKMPDKRCQTCKNLFHSSCLFKWFASSNQSTCPLCRNPFTYGDTGRRRGTGGE